MTTGLILLAANATHSLVSRQLHGVRTLQTAVAATTGLSPERRHLAFLHPISWLLHPWTFNRAFRRLLKDVTSRAPGHITTSVVTSVVSSPVSPAAMSAKVHDMA